MQNMEDGKGLCPVCRKVFHAKDLEHVLDLVGAHSQLVRKFIIYSLKARSFLLA